MNNYLKFVVSIILTCVAFFFLYVVFLIVKMMRFM